MRIGLVVYGSLSTVSGGSLYDRQLVSYLVRRGHRVEMLDLPARAYGWVKRPNEAFAGRSALQVMLDGELTDLMRVRRYLDAARGPW